MTENEICYQWGKIKNGISLAAMVTLVVIENTSNYNEILEHYSGIGFTSQGKNESITPDGYYSWKLAARHGLKYAFSFTDAFWTVDIKKIEGREFIDTNPTVVAYTVMRAFLDKVCYKLNPDQIEVLEDFVLSSWTKPYKELIPDFFNLTFTDYVDSK